MISREVTPDPLFRLYQEHGDAKALGGVFDLVAPELFTVAVHITRCPDRAEDLVQSVFLRAMESRDQWQPDEPLQQWLMGLLSKELAQTKLQKAHSIRTEDLDEVELTPGQRDPIGQALLVELDDRLRRTIERLPELYREVVRLSVQEGRTSQEVGGLLKRSPATVRSQLARGLDRLRQLLPATLGLSILCSGSGVGEDWGRLLENLRRRILDKAQDEISSAGNPAGGTLSATPVKWFAAAMLGLGAFGLWESMGADELEHRVFGAELSWVEGAESLLEVRASRINSFGALPTRRVIATAKAPASEEAHVFGQVVGPNGNPLSGAEVRLLSAGPWVDRPGASTKGEFVDWWDTCTDEAGAFSFQVPLPDHYAPILRVDAGPGHTRSYRWFASSWCNLGPIQVGENPMGVIRLQGAGGLGGQVLAHDGSPAYPAQIVLTPGKDPRLGSIVSTRPDGTFDAAGLIAGYQQMHVHHGGQWLVREGVPVHAGHLNSDLLLKFPAPSPLRVHVTDPLGRGLADVGLQFASQAQYPDLPSAIQTTGLDGWAMLSVPAGGAQVIKATVLGYVAEQESFALQAGQELLEVSMAPSPWQKVQTFDARTGLPLPGSVLQVQEFEHGQWIDQGVSINKKPEGKPYLTVSMLPGQRLRVVHAGYSWVLIERSAFGQDPMPVAMEPLKSIRCRILLEGRPQAGLEVEVCAGVFGPGVTDEKRSKRLHFKGLGSQYAWPESDSKGQIEFEVFSMGLHEYCLRARVGQDWALEHWFTLPEDDRSVVDLGDLHLEPAGSLRGTVSTPDGMSPAGLTILLDTTFGSQAASVNARGEFLFEGVTPGQHKLHFRARLGLNTAGVSVAVSAIAGKVVGASIDLRPYALSSRQLRLSENGQPLVGARVYLRASGEGSPSSHAGFLGTTDAEGLVQGELPVDGFAEVWVQPKGAEVARKHPSARVELSTRVEPVLVVDF